MRRKFKRNLNLNLWEILICEEKKSIPQSSVPPFVTQVMDYDECLEELGEFGPWQITITLLVWIPAVVDGIMTLTRYIIIIITTIKVKNLTLIFTSSYTTLKPPAYRCNIPGCEDKENFTFYDFTPELLFPSLANLNGSDPPDNPNYCDYFKPSSAANGSCLQVTSCGIYCFH